jgi:hypothetical protein
MAVFLHLVVQHAAQHAAQQRRRCAQLPAAALRGSRRRSGAGSRGRHARRLSGRTADAARSPGQWRALLLLRLLLVIACRGRGLLLRVELHGNERALLLLWSAIGRSDVRRGAAVRYDILGRPAGRHSLGRTLLLVLRIWRRRAVCLEATRSLPGQLLRIGSALALASWSARRRAVCARHV